MLELLQMAGTGLLGAVAFFAVMAAIVFIIHFAEEISGTLFCIAVAAALLIGIPYGAYQIGEYLLEQIP